MLAEAAYVCSYLWHSYKRASMTCAKKDKEHLAPVPLDPETPSPQHSTAHSLTMCCSLAKFVLLVFTLVELCPTTTANLPEECKEKEQEDTMQDNLRK